MLLLLTLLAAAPVHAKARFDIYRCNRVAGRAGLGAYPTIQDTPYYRIDESGNLEFDRGNPRTLLVKLDHGKNEDEAAYYESYEHADPLRFGEGLGGRGVIQVQLKLHREKGRPALLESTDTWYATDVSWEKLRKSLAAHPPKKNERTRTTESWLRYGFSGDRCYVSQEGGSVQGRTLVSFDQGLCNQVLRLTDRDPVDLLHDYREGDTFAKNEARRVLRLIRDAQVARDERLKGEGKRLLAVEAPPEHQLPGTLPAEDSSALQELRGCLAALERNGLRRPEALTKESSDFMGNEPGLEEPSAAGAVPPSP